MNRFVALDSWRGICACLVAFMHFDVYSHFHTLPFVWNSYLFVDFFFVLSGFVISASYRTRLTRGFGVCKFMLLRFGRVYPLHLFMLGCFIAFEVIRFAPIPLGASPEVPLSTSEEQSLGTVAANVALVHGLGVLSSLTWNRPSWSISTEFFTYLIFGLSIIWLRKHDYLAISIVMIVSPIFIAYVSNHNMNTTFDYGFARCVYGFAAGMVAFRTYDFYRRRTATVNRVVATFAEVAAVAIAVVFVLLAGERTISVLAPYVFLIVVVVFSVERGLISHVMTYRPLVTLGTLSYSIYMIHLFVQSRLFDIGQVVESWAGVPVQTYVDVEHKKLLGTQLWYGDLLHLAMLPLVIAVSYLTYRFIEEPSRGWFRAVSQGLFLTGKYRPLLVEGSELAAVPVRDAGQAR